MSNHLVRSQEKDRPQLPEPIYRTISVQFNPAQAFAYNRIVTAFAMSCLYSGEDSLGNNTWLEAAFLNLKVGRNLAGLVSDHSWTSKDAFSEGRGSSLTNQKIVRVNIVSRRLWSLLSVCFALGEQPAFELHFLVSFKVVRHQSSAYTCPTCNKSLCSGRPIAIEALKSSRRPAFRRATVATCQVRSSMITSFQPDEPLPCSENATVSSSMLVKTIHVSNDVNQALPSCDYCLITQPALLPLQDCTLDAFAFDLVCNPDRLLESFDLEVLKSRQAFSLGVSDVRNAEKNWAAFLEKTAANVSPARLAEIGDLLRLHDPTGVALSRAPEGRGRPRVRHLPRGQLRSERHSALRTLHMHPLPLEAEGGEREAARGRQQRQWGLDGSASAAAGLSVRVWESVRDRRPVGAAAGVPDALWAVVRRLAQAGVHPGLRAAEPGEEGEGGTAIPSGKNLDESHFCFGLHGRSFRSRIYTKL